MVLGVTGHVAVFLTICTGRFTGRLVHYLYFSGPDVIPLKHYGKREVLGKIANMEAEYDKPMHFDPDLLPMAATGHQGFWDYGMEVAGKAKKYSKQTPPLEATMYGFEGGEELLGVKKYLYQHGKYQLVAVSSWNWSPRGGVRHLGCIRSHGFDFVMFLVGTLKNVKVFIFSVKLYKKVFSLGLFN